MSQLSKDQIQQIVELVHEHQHPEKFIVFNGDKQKLFNSIARIETKMDGLSCKYHRKAIDKFSDEINQVKVDLEKARYANIMAIFSIFASISSVVSVIIVIMNK